ncbi:MAG: metal-dependent hydrolase [Planctomycetota bacterium]|nr:metal-dependent hydrolase [Planctomycetota bacterium]MDI6787802.1 metal-dependent hydrolase [Planctomycetota bacterium]
MNPITHMVISWNTAAVSPVEKRDRILITLGGMIPDIDGLSILADLVFPSGYGWFYYHKYHHYLAHNITAIIVWVLFVLLIAKRKVVTAFLSFIVFHLHLLCDIVGARGPRECDIWTIPYLSPFSSALTLSWKQQWELNGWQNFVITIIMFAIVFIISWKKGYSPLEIFSAKMDKLFVQTLRQRFTHYC